MSDFYETIKSRIEDEKRDVATYEDLAANAPNDGAAQILRDIACEENLHALHLSYILSNKDDTADSAVTPDGDFLGALMSVAQAQEAR